MGEISLLSLLTKEGRQYPKKGDVNTPKMGEVKHHPSLRCFVPINRDSSMTKGKGGVEKMQRVS
jgi:hypothetical protein